MTSPLFGHIDKFDANGKEIFSNYLERLEFYFLANDISDDGKKKAIFLSSVGSETYKLIRDLCTPDAPTSKNFTDICSLLNEHLNPEPNVIVERYTFYSRTRKENESVADYVAQLRHLSRHCNFRDLNDNIRDRIVCGVNNSQIQQKLLSVGNALTLDKALKLAISIETASKNAKSIHGETPIHKVDSKDKECYRCGGDHDPNSCKFKDKECFYCKNQGHTAKMCRKKKYQGGKKGKEAPVKQVETEASEEEGDSQAGTDGNEMYHMYRCDVRREDPIFIHPKINGKDAKMELDTGAALTCMGNKKFRESHPNAKVHKTNIKLKTFSGEIMEPIGIADVEVESEGKSTKLPIVITPGDTPTLLGRNWLKQLKIDWKRVFDVLKTENQDGRPEELGEVLEKHKSVFSEGLGKLKDYKVNIELKEFAKPRFCKARTVPYALRGRIEKELDRLVKKGIYVPEKYSRWAAPIVPMEKPDGGLRLCGDYKMTINPRTKCDNYPVPKWRICWRL